MTPREIVAELDKHIVGQGAAKRAVAIALRNRWRRMQIDDPLRQEITPKNILMIGPTGCGKTEIARRLARLANAPFVKVEATKFTEVGYVGRDVDSIIKDLAEVAVKMTRERRDRQGARARARMRPKSACSTRCCPQPKMMGFSTDAEPSPRDQETRQKFRKMLREGAAERPRDRARTARHSARRADHGAARHGRNAGAALEHVRQPRRRAHQTAQAQGEGSAEAAASKRKPASSSTRKSCAPARSTNAEQNGIVFIDEIDKIARRQETMGADVSREGVQRDLLPLVEGSTVSTKYGQIKTDHILFIASGAFHMSKPSDLIPELQGRFPIRVELEFAGGGRLRAHPHRARCLADRAVQGAAGHRERWT